MKKPSLFCLVSALLLSMAVYGETFQKNALAFDYPQGYEITSTETAGLLVVSCTPVSGESSIVFTQMTNSLFALIDPSEADDICKEALKDAGGKMENNADYRSVKVGEPQKAGLKYLSGVQSTLDIETRNRERFSGSLFATLKGEHMLIIVMIVSDHALEISEIANSVRLGDDAMVKPDDSVQARDNAVEEQEEEIFLIAEVMPEFPGGPEALFRYLGENIQYPVIAQENCVQGRSICSVVIEKDGTVTNVEVVRSAGDPSLDKEAVRVLRGMPKWKPGMHDGTPVRVRYTMPVVFKIVSPEPKQEEEVFVVVEKMPEFPGGLKALFRYLSENVKYPVIAQENGIQGEVICSFVIEKDGSITNAEVVRSAGDASLDKEAVRVLRGMPRWSPGIQEGAPVRVKYTVPVNFRLGKPKKNTRK